MGSVFKYFHWSSNLAKTSHFNLCEVSIPYPHLVWADYRKQQDGIHISCEITLFPRGIWLKIKLCQNVVYCRSLQEFKSGRKKLEHCYKMLFLPTRGEKRNKTNSYCKIHRLGFILFCFGVVLLLLLLFCCM